MNVKNCSIFNNNCRHGGGISLRNNRGVVENCRIYDNTCYENGNQIQFWSSATLLSNCFIKDSQNRFDVIEFRGGSTPLLENNIIISNNTSVDEGVFLSWEVSSPILINNTIVNSTGQQGTLITIEPPSHFTIINSIAVGYTMNSGLGYLAEFCRLDNVPLDGEGNISNQPLLNNDYSLSDCSPCIGLGTPSIVFHNTTYYAPENDYLYNARPQPTSSNPDMGAIENELGVRLIPPSIISQPVDTTICENSSYTLNIEAEGSPVLYYQWQKDSVDIADETNSFLILDNLTQSDQANYRCLVSNSCETISSNNAFINVAQPFLSTEDIQICEGESHKGWTETGIYIDSLSSVTGCDSIVTTNLTVHQTYELEEDVSICEGSSYKGWTASDTYTENLKTITGCDSTVITNLSFYPVYKPEIMSTGDTLYSINQYPAYQWLDEDGAILGTNNDFVIDKSGEYHLVVTDDNSCNQTSESIYVVKTGIDTQFKSDFKYNIFPNPNTGIFSFRIDSNPLDKLTLRLINSIGQTIEVRQAENVTEDFDISHLSKGVYHLVISSDDYQKSEKIMVR